MNMRKVLDNVYWMCIRFYQSTVIGYRFAITSGGQAEYCRYESYVYMSFTALRYLCGYNYTIHIAAK